MVLRGHRRNQVYRTKAGLRQSLDRKARILIKPTGRTPCFLSSAQGNKGTRTHCGGSAARPNSGPLRCSAPSHETAHTAKQLLKGRLSRKEKKISDFANWPVQAH